MKYRWKLLILLLVLSIVPIVSLRTFGIHNVQVMADHLSHQVQTNMEIVARQRLELMIGDYVRALRTSRDQVEMALFYQAAEFSRIMRNPPWVPEEADDEIAGADTPPCISRPPDAGSADVALAQSGLNRMQPVFQAASQYLGDLVLTQYLGWPGGVFGAYPCNPGLPTHARAADQPWYRWAFAEKATLWSRPFRDPVSGTMVFAVSYPVFRADETLVGVASLLVSVDRLMEKVFYPSGLPEGAAAFFCTLAAAPDGGTVGARVLASSRSEAESVAAGRPWQAPQWLNSGDAAQLKALLTDMARRRSGVRQMPFRGRMSFWAYGPLLHQGSAFVLIAPREKIVRAEGRSLLAAIGERLNRVRLYSASFLLFLALVVAAAAMLFSRSVTRPLARLTEASQRLAAGDFDVRVPVSSTDEFGLLGGIFNRIGPQLKEHYRMRRSLEVAEEVQQHLLPQEPPRLPGLDIHGMTLFSDETGGDYFDFLCVDEKNRDKFCVAVGDVAGHGISAALLMAFVRGLLRSRVKEPGSLGKIVAEVNGEFTQDMEDSGQFMTLFLARVRRDENYIEWVRAGHEPGLLYRLREDSFSMLHDGSGMALGLEAEAEYQASRQEFEPGDVIYLGTDGVTEARNPADELFGLQRVQQVIRQQALAPAKTIALSILDAVEEFRHTAAIEDDLTVVVIKVTNCG